MDWTGSQYWLPCAVFRKQLGVVISYDVQNEEDKRLNACNEDRGLGRWTAWADERQRDRGVPPRSRATVARTEREANYAAQQNANKREARWRICLFSRNLRNGKRRTRKENRKCRKRKGVVKKKGWTFGNRLGNCFENYFGVFKGRRRGPLRKLFTELKNGNWKTDSNRGTRERETGTR